MAELSVWDAKLFLNNCGDKTVKARQASSVARNGQFLASELNRHMRTKNLRGVWTGLDKKNPDCRPRTETLF